MTMENSGIVATRMAAIAVPMRGVAMDKPINWPATVVAPTAASAPHRRNAKRRRPIAASSIRTPLAISARNVTAPTQPKARTTLSTSTNEKPQITASAT